MLDLTTKQINAFKKKNIENILQFHRWTPLRFYDNTRETGLRSDLNEQYAVVIGKLIKVEQSQTSAGKTFTKCTVRDRISQKNLKVNIFHNGSIAEFRLFSMWTNSLVLATGKLSFHPIYGYTIMGPACFTNKIQENMRMIPVFSKVKGISDVKLEEILHSSLNNFEEETVPINILQQARLMDINSAVKANLFPSSQQELFYGKRRFLFDDLYYLAGRMELENRDWLYDGPKIQSSAIAEQVIKELPFPLTKGQSETFYSVRQHLLAGEHFHALVQGDVGCGKTLVAILTMCLCAENGLQTVIMAPTQILAQQHYNEFQKYLGKHNITCVLMTSKMKAKERKEVLKNIENGNTKIIIGTHSILSDQIVFNNLSMLIIDEEHKFGVQQRDKIQKKAKNIDYISMSATPIPRTLANAMYGSKIEVFSIKDKPGGRKEVKTIYDNGDNLQKYIQGIFNMGQQVYAVCPMITEADDESTMAGVLSTQEATQKYKKMFPDKNIVELTGLNTAEETKAILDDFKAGKIHMLVSTTVVEVGVNVPNATLMIIHNAERFGLAGMHQLRGRVGRGDAQSYCILESKDSPVLNERLKTLIETNDGFEIAEKDMMMLRKSGDLFGDEQSGRNKYVDEMVMYPALYNSIKQVISKVDSVSIQKHIDKLVLCEIQGHMKPIK